MLYRTLGKTNEKVSAIGLGGYHLGHPPDPADAIRIVRSAIDRGINFMDNCWDYYLGESEKRMGAALRGAEERRTQRSDDLPDSVFVLGEAGANDAGVKAVGVQLRRAPGQLAGEQDVAQLRGAVRAWRVGLLRLQVVKVQAPGPVGARRGGYDAAAGKTVSQQVR